MRLQNITTSITHIETFAKLSGFPRSRVLCTTRRSVIRRRGSQRQGEIDASRYGSQKFADIGERGVRRRSSLAKLTASTGSGSGICSRASTPRRRGARRTRPDDDEGSAAQSAPSVLLEEEIADRASWRRFLGLSAADDTPDHSTSRFTEAAPDAEVLRNEQLDEKGLILRKGTVIDASVVEARARTPSGPGRTSSDVDPEADWGGKGRRAVFGYKGHFRHGIAAGAGRGGDAGEQHRSVRPVGETRGGRGVCGPGVRQALEARRSGTPGPPTV